jgi:hypothetical protein
MFWRCRNVWDRHVGLVAEDWRVLDMCAEYRVILFPQGFQTLVVQGNRAPSLTKLKACSVSGFSYRSKFKHGIFQRLRIEHKLVRRYY